VLIGVLVVQVLVVGLYASRVPTNLLLSIPPTAYRTPLTTPAARWLRFEGIELFEVQVPSVAPNAKLGRISATQTVEAARNRGGNFMEPP
jgi:hypothetical protein